jgi:glycerophosphoryl diester phosphodiesterase
MAVQVMAHRGGEGRWPSNTLYAFEQALALGVDSLELDIHMSADGALVVRHDPVVETTTNGRGAIRDLTLAQIQALDAGYTWTTDGREYPFRGRGITIPTLGEVFQAFPNTRINIDIKPQEPQVVDRFVEILRRFERLKSVVVGSFHERQLGRFRRLCPQVLTAAGVSETRTFYGMQRLGLAGLYQPRAYAFQIPETYGSRRIITPAFIRAAHSRGMQVHVWTVNDVADMRRLIEWGVDGLITDFPDRALAL